MIDAFNQACRTVTTNEQAQSGSVEQCVNAATEHMAECYPSTSDDTQHTIFIVSLIMI